jgi:hypothetical protein
VAVFARTNRTKAIIDRSGLAHLESIGAMVAEDQPPDTVWPAVRAALLDELRLVEATFEPDGQRTSRLTVLERNGHVEINVMYWTREGMELPRDGVVLPVRAGTRSYGQIVLEPTHGRGTTLDQRRVAVALGDLLAVTLDRHPTDNKTSPDAPPTNPRA